MTVYVQNYETKTSKFPGGESHFEYSEPEDSIFKFKQSTKIINIVCNFTSNDDLILVAMAVDATRKLFGNDVKIYLDIPYFPYARQDRHTAPGNSFSLKIVTNFINSLKVDKIYVDDPHSIALTSLLDNVEVMPFYLDNFSEYFYKLSPEENERLVVVSPDAGAVKRSKAVAEQYNLRFAIADKKRDPVSGNILETNIYGDIHDNDIVVIVDDICDGGRTFTELAKTLKASYTGLRINLFVTFGIFSKGMDVFEDFETVQAEHKFWSK